MKFELKKNQKSLYTTENNCFTTKNEFRLLITSAFRRFDPNFVL